MTTSTQIPLLSQTLNLRRKSKLFNTRNLSFLISLLLLLALSGVANATYTDYIGAGQKDGVTVTTCSDDDEAEGSKTIDASGLSGPSGTHDNYWINGWVAFAGDTNPNPARSSYDYWIQYDFGEIYNLMDMWVWNSNGDNGGDHTDRGLNNVYIDYSTNGTTWTPLTSTQFPRANNSSSYPGFAGPDFGGAAARYVLISAVDNWGEPGWYGLAEVKFNVGAGTQVEILGSWVDESDLSRAKVAGSDRALIFTAHVEDNDSPTVNLASVTYGGEPMIKVIDEIYLSSQDAYVVAYYLDEAGITAATSGTSFSLSWGSNSPDKAGYSSVFLSGVDQTYPLGYALSATGANYNVSTNPLPTSSGDMVILAGTCGDTGDYDVGTGSGFTEAIELTISQADGIAGYKSATGADETPSIDHSKSYPQALIGFVVQTEGGTAPDTTPPTPTTSTWSVVPVAISAGSITMTADNATDDSGVEYEFNEITGNPGGDDRGWQDSRTYTDDGLSPQTQYTYQVRTRDKCPYQNTGIWSTSESATTTEAPPPAEGCPEGDLTGDCAIKLDDLKCLTDQWLVSDCASIPPGCACADLDGHTLVDFNDYAILAGDWGKAGTGPVINELMPENDSNVQDPYGEYDDWFEIHNPTSAPIDINGMWVENDDRDWQIPESHIIPAYGFVVLWADRDTHQGPLHVDFRLDKDGDHIALYADDNGQPGTLIDTVTYDDSDVQPDYSYGRFPDAFDSWYTMDDPTPDANNTIGMARPPYFSHPGGTFATNFDVGLTTKSPTANIYYTTNGDEPTDSSTPYIAPFLIHDTNWVRARAYEPGLGLDPSYIVSKTYIKLDPDVETFQSNLPIVIINSFGLNIDDENRDFHPVSAVFIDTDELTGTAAITDSAEWAGYGGMHIRGNSTEGWEKRQFRFETWNENNPDPDPKARYMDMDVSLLGFPAESDWIIHGPYADRTLMRNLQTYTWSRQIGRYAAKSRFVELFYDKDGAGSPVSWNSGTEASGSDYWGVYIFMEKVKRSDDRVDIERLEPQHISEPEVTGGYLFKKDWEVDFETAIYDEPLIYEDPRMDELEPAQMTWIENYFDDFDVALAGSDFNNPAHADYYGNYIDIDSWIDHHIIVEIAKNVDGFMLSTFLYKDRGGKINMGPIWDYNGGYGARYFCSYDPEGWFHEFDENVCIDRLTDCGCTGEGGVTFPNEDNPNAYNWYLRLTTDLEFLLAYADNWFDHREGDFKTANMMADIDNNVTLLTTNLTCVGPDNAVDRNFLRWDTLDEDLWPDLWSLCNSSNAYQDFVDFLKTWLTARLTWMDGEINGSYGNPPYGKLPPEIFLEGSPADEGGHANVSDEVTMTSGGGTIYYTTDGNDPREYDGITNPDATAYSSAIPLTGSEQFKARIRYSETPTGWSALNEATFAVGPVADNLRITEMMYHPQDTGDPINDPNAEFIELKNIHGSTPINLNLVKFTNGIDFTFSDITLGPGSYIIVIRDPTAFALHHPSYPGIIAGQYTGRLNNAGERIELQDAVGQVIHNFSFKDGWYHITDGSGFSLDANNPSDPDPNAWEYSEGWRPSSVIKGTPGADDTGHVAATGDIVINEVMTHTDAPPEDWIELHNTTSSPIDIGGWFLSDNDNDFTKYEIAASTSIPPNGYIVFTEDANFGSLASDPGSNVPFALSEHGETVYLSSGSGSVLTGGFCTKEDFKAAENGVTFGRYTKSAQSGYDVDFVAMSSPTYEVANSGPKVGPVVISEIMYHPATVNQLNNYAEYIELYNISGGSVSLDGWQLTDEDGAIEYYFPPGTNLGNGQRLLLVKNLVAFEAEFGPVGGVTILEYVEGRLSNAGEKIQISKPGDPEPDFIPYIRVDRVNYSDGSHPENFHELPGGDPWPTSPDGGGQSLHRDTLGDYGNDVANWVSGAHSPGS